jgi:GAF domain-containing protein
MENRKSARYQRIGKQLADLFEKNQDPLSRMATLNALLYHKMDGFFWVGFYLLHEGRLIVGPYQGPLACLELAKDKGVCWAGINRNQTVVVPDVHAFPDHIACDSRSKSEIVIPLHDKEGRVTGVLDIDSDRPDNFDETDIRHLEEMVGLLFS